VKVHVAAINPVDYKIKGGFDDWGVPLPFTPGYDFSGVVEDVHPDDQEFKVGDEVFGCQWGDGDHGAPLTVGGVTVPVGSCFAEYVLVRKSCASKKPAALSHKVAAAGATLASLTAYQGLDRATVKSGSRILILGGSGAVGQMAIQLAKSRGAWVATTCSTRSVPFVSQFAPDRIIDYAKENWWELQDLNVDAVFDTVGCDGLVAKAKAILPADGALVSIATFDFGFDPNGHPPLRHAAAFVLANSTKMQDDIASLLVDGRIKVVVDSEFPFSQQGVTDIFAKIISGKSLGKNILNVA